MFHVTEAENVASILRDGLTPQIGDRSRELGETLPAVYAFPTAQACHDALMNWLGEWHEEQEDRTGKTVELAIIAFDPSGLAQAEQEVDWEARFVEPIPAGAFRAIFSEKLFGEWFYRQAAA